MNNDPFQTPPTLRDYFALQAMASLFNEHVMHMGTEEQAAARCYKAADAMLRAREEAAKPKPDLPATVQALAAAASQVGQCKAVDSARPEHADHCARCRLRRAWEDYKEALS